MKASKPEIFLLCRGRDLKGLVEFVLFRDFMTVGLGGLVLFLPTPKLSLLITCR
jgi:hypothetical protein